MKIDVRCKKPKMYFVKASWQVGIKYVSSKKIQIKTNSDNTKDNILKYKVGIIWSVIQFQILLFFSLP